MTSSSIDDEARVLDGPDFAPLLERLANEPSPSLATIVEEKKRYGEGPFAAACRIANARRKAAGKVPEAGRLWLEPVGAEQATHHLVAAHKASRFHGLCVADLCCGIGGDTFALAKSARHLIAIDQDTATLRRLGRNLEILNLSVNVQLIRADAAWPPLPPDMAIHIDPDRRAKDRSARPTRQIDEYAPPVAALIRLASSHCGGAIKLGPASEFDELEKLVRATGTKVETEIVSLHGECKEATLWFGELAGHTPRRATLLPGGDSIAGKVLPLPPAMSANSSPCTWLFETETALARSGLIGMFAAGHHLIPLTTDGAWLFGSQPIETPWLTSFEVVADLPADRKVVRAEARKLGWNAAVIKTRGGIRADQFMNWFDGRPDGMTRQTMLVARSRTGKLRALLALRHF